MTREQIHALSGLVGKPYRLGASGPDAFDCYGLAREILRLSRIELPPVERVSDYIGTMRDHAERQNWTQVDAPEEFDLVLMANVLRRDRHIGVYVRPSTAGVVIHAYETMGVCLHDLQSLKAIGMNELRFYRRKVAA